MWTRSAANRTTGLITVVCTDWNNGEYFRGTFSTLAEAEEAGRNAERRMTTAMNSPENAEPLPEMTDAELLAELTEMGFA